jgi:hypothetical protein
VLACSVNVSQRGPSRRFSSASSVTLLCLCGFVTYSAVYCSLESDAAEKSKVNSTKSYVANDVTVLHLPYTNFNKCISFLNTCVGPHKTWP